jgi:hypothetical protein
MADLFDMEEEGPLEESEFAPEPNLPVTAAQALPAEQFKSIQEQTTPALGAFALAHLDSEARMIQNRIIQALKNPRDYDEATAKILKACERPALAERSTYDYSRGGTKISGPTYRLVLEMAGAWRNLDWGWTEIQRYDDYSEVEMACLDLESNNRTHMRMVIPHYRHTKKAKYRITDPRDIYEMIANFCSRRVRTCIQNMIPLEIQEVAVETCDRTMRSSSPITEKAIADSLLAFQSLGVSREQIELRIQRRFDTTIAPSQWIGLRRIYASLKQESSQVSDWFTDQGEIDGAADRRIKPGIEGLREALKITNKEEEKDEQ